VVEGKRLVASSATDLLKAALPAAGIEAKIGYNNFLDCQLTSNINNLIDGLKTGKDNFINDILTDENGVSFHRLQMVVFTTVLGFVFVYTAWATLTRWRRPKRLSRRTSQRGRTSWPFRRLSARRHIPTSRETCRLLIEDCRLNFQSAI